MEWAVRQESQIQSVLHYLDDFLFLGPEGSRVCSVLLRTMERMAELFGVPLAPEKTESPVTVIKFLGIVIDSVRMECRLPEDKLLDLRMVVARARSAKKLRLRELQSLIGKIQFACRIIPMGRVFCRRLALSTAGVSVPSHFVRLAADVREDLSVWTVFLNQFNGRAVMLEGPMSNSELELYTDASGSLGFGAYFQGSWCAARWPTDWIEKGFCRNMVLLEFFPILVAVFVWGERFRDKWVRFYSDNLGVVTAVNRQTAHSPPVINLLRRFVLRCLMLNLHFSTVHLPGVTNCIADALSRFQWDRFRELAPEADAEGLPCPEHLWSLL